MNCEYEAKAGRSRPCALFGTQRAKNNELRNNLSEECPVAC